MKAHTDLEQSKKLSKILPIENADMWFANGIYLIKTSEEPKDIQGVFPCWSLSALFDILPDDTNIIKDKSDTENEKYMCTVGVKGDIISTFGNNPVDVCYKMILKLHELNLL